MEVLSLIAEELNSCADSFINTLIWLDKSFEKFTRTNPDRSKVKDIFFLDKFELSCSFQS